MGRIIKNKDMDKELRLRGAALRLLFPKPNIKFSDLSNYALNTFVKGRARSKKINYRQEYVLREDGSKLRLCIYTPKVPFDNELGLLWIHGGGYAIGKPEQDISFIEEFVLSSNCVIVAPDYTLSVESPFPSALNDCVLALSWLKDNTKDLHVNSSQIFVGGDSAGGGLTCSLCLYARDKKIANIAFQMPLYPMIDSRETESSKNNDAPVWNTESNRYGWGLYLRGLKEEEITKYAVPALETDYTNLPPAITYCGDIDPFRDETAILVDNLRNSGVNVNFKMFKGCYHGFDIVCPKSKVAREAKKFLIDGFLYAKKNYFKEQ